MVIILLFAGKVVVSMILCVRIFFQLNVFFPVVCINPVYFYVNVHLSLHSKVNRLSNFHFFVVSGNEFSQGVLINIKIIQKDFFLFLIHLKIIVHCLCEL